MQKITLYATANETLASVRDSANARSASAPVFVRDVEVELHLRLFANANEPNRYILPSGIVSYGWYMDDDFKTSTAFKIVGDNADIVVVEVEDSTDPDTGETIYGYTDIKIPISNMNSEALVEWLGENKSMTGLIGELCGYDSTGASIFVLQIEGFTVRNRLSDTGEPSENVENYLTIDEARALFAGSAVPDNTAYNQAVIVTGSGTDDIDGIYKFFPEITFDWYSSGIILKDIFYNDEKKAFLRYTGSRWAISKKLDGGGTGLIYIYPWIPSASNLGCVPTDFWYKHFGTSAQPLKNGCFVRYVPKLSVIKTSY